MTKDFMFKCVVKTLIEALETCRDEFKELNYDDGQLGFIDSAINEGAKYIKHRGGWMLDDEENKNREFFSQDEAMRMYGILTRLVAYDYKDNIIGVYGYKGCENDICEILAKHDEEKHND